MSEHQIVRLCCEAMATRFEVALSGGDPARLRAAGEEALAEVERLDRRLSRFRPESDISLINRRAAREPVKVEPWLFDLLRAAADISALTDDAFDVTVAPLMRLWGFPDGPGRVPLPRAVDAARKVVGMRHVILCPDDFSVRFDREGVQIDLGGIGKGWAVDRAVETLVESGVTSALVHGGTSSVRAIGRPPDAPAWRIAVRSPTGDGISGAFDLHDSALGVSAVHGRSFVEGSVEYGHVIDPRSGRPGSRALLAAVTGPSATVCDALSTALLTLGDSWLENIESRFEGCRGRVVARGLGSTP